MRHVLPGMLHRQWQRSFLELLSDPVVLMIERGISKAIATISHRYAKANNKINIFNMAVPRIISMITLPCPRLAGRKVRMISCARLHSNYKRPWHIPDSADCIGNTNVHKDRSEIDNCGCRHCTVVVVLIELWLLWWLNCGCCSDCTVVVVVIELLLL